MHVRKAKFLRLPFRHLTMFRPLVGFEPQRPSQWSPSCSSAPIVTYISGFIINRGICEIPRTGTPIEVCSQDRIRTCNTSLFLTDNRTAIVYQFRHLTILKNQLWVSNPTPITVVNVICVSVPLT